MLYSAAGTGRALVHGVDVGLAWLVEHGALTAVAATAICAICMPRRACTRWSAPRPGWAFFGGDVAIPARSKVAGPMRGLGVGELSKLVWAIDTVFAEVSHRPVDVCGCIPLLPCLPVHAF